METTASFGYWVRRQRKALDLTQQVLAERVGCSLAAIKKIEGDERRPSRQIAERLAEVLAVPAQQRELFLEIARGIRSADRLLLAQEASGASLPTGTVTLLFTDIEGSTQLWAQHPEAMATSSARHDEILREAIQSGNGHLFQVVGDSFCAAFHTADDALRAARKAQLDLQSEDWGKASIRVRMGLHTGQAEVRPDGSYRGYVTLSHAQHLTAVGHGGQILLSQATQQLVQEGAGEGIQLQNLGEHRLKSFDAAEPIYQVIGAGLPVEFPPLSSLSVISNNLPAQLTSFIGREHEMADVRRLLRTHRLVTLTGSGGTGKTRLSLQIAPDFLDQFQDGVWFVELAPVRDGALIPQTLMRILGLSAESGRQPLDTLTGYLARKSLLIILDNCEHLLTECGWFVDAVLQASSAVKVLATSREALNLVGEQAYRVPSLRTPDVNHLPSVQQLLQFEAVNLFIERAALVSSGFAVTDVNARAVSQICRRMDGIPLAIELAAARVKSMPLEALVSRLDDRFRLLTGGSRNALPRQQTLRATIDWSYALLDEPEKLLLQRLSVFRGGWTLEAAESVCSGAGIEESKVLDLLANLVDKSLLWLDEEGRYQILETVRQYAGERMIDLGQAEWARDRHVHFMLDLAEQAEPEVRGHNQLIWLNRLDAEADNLRAALNWAQGHDHESFLRLASSIWRFWEIRVGNFEEIDWLEYALALPQKIRSMARARAMARLAWAYCNQYNEERAEGLARQACELSADLQDKPGLALALGVLGRCHILKKPGEAVSLAEQALDLARELNDHWLMSNGLFLLGDAAFFRNDLTLAATWFEEALTEARRSGDNRFVTISLTRLAWANRAQGNAEPADTLLHEALSTARAIGDVPNIVSLHVSLACVMVLREDYLRAEQLLEESLALAKAINDRLGIPWALKYLGLLEWARGNGTAISERAQASLDLARQAHEPILVAEALWLLGEGHRLTGKVDLARLRYTEALVASQEQDFREGYCHCLQGLGALALACGQAEWAVRLFAARAKLRETTFAEDFYPFMVRERERQLAEARAQLGEDLFNAAWAAGQAMNEADAVAYALQGS